MRFSSEAELRCYLSGASRDGTYSSRHRTLRISQKGTEWLEVLRLALGELGSKSWMYREGKRDVFTLETTWCSMLVPRNHRERVAFARGYFDAEGGVPRNPDARFYVQLVQKDLRDLDFVRGCLESVGIKCGKIHNPSVAVDPDYWRFFVRASSQTEFCRIVSSWHPRKRPLLEKHIRSRTMADSATLDGWEQTRITS